MPPVSAGYASICKHSPAGKGALVNHCGSGILEACVLVRSTEPWSQSRLHYIMGAAGSGAEQNSDGAIA